MTVPACVLVSKMFEESQGSFDFLIQVMSILEISTFEEEGQYFSLVPINTDLPLNAYGSIWKTLLEESLSLSQGLSTLGYPEKYNFFPYGYFSEKLLVVATVVYLLPPNTIEIWLLANSSLTTFFSSCSSYFGFLGSPTMLPQSVTFRFRRSISYQEFTNGPIFPQNLLKQQGPFSSPPFLLILNAACSKGQPTKTMSPFLPSLIKALSLGSSLISNLNNKLHSLNVINVKTFADQLILYSTFLILKQIQNHSNFSSFGSYRQITKHFLKSLIFYDKYYECLWLQKLSMDLGRLRSIIVTTSLYFPIVKSFAKDLSFNLFMSRGSPIQLIFNYFSPSSNLEIIQQIGCFSISQNSLIFCYLVLQHSNQNRQYTTRDLSSSSNIPKKDSTNLASYQVQFIKFSDSFMIERWNKLTYQKSMFDVVLHPPLSCFLEISTNPLGLLVALSISSIESNSFLVSHQQEGYLYRATSNISTKLRFLLQPPTGLQCPSPVCPIRFLE